ncbi:MAG TPA: hypothetical protein VE422_23390 [Terriglobia bacterium]|nr:hypothetical protein [Terriglobia bacterium]
MTLRIRREGFLLLFVALLCFPGLLCAQAEEFRRVELSAGVGLGWLSDGQGTLGNGTDTAVSAAIFVVPRLSAGIEVHRTVHSGLLPLQGQNRRSDGRVTFTSFKTSYYLAHADIAGFGIAPYVTSELPIKTCRGYR